MKLPHDHLKDAGYTPAEINAAREYVQRRDRKKTRPEHLTRLADFTQTNEPSESRKCGGASRAWKYSEMNAARTAEHCAEVFGVLALNVKRIARYFDGYLMPKPAATAGEEALSRRAA